MCFGMSGWTILHDAWCKMPILHSTHNTCSEHDIFCFRVPVPFANVLFL